MAVATSKDSSRVPRLPRESVGPRSVPSAVSPRKLRDWQRAGALPSNWPDIDPAVLEERVAAVARFLGKQGEYAERPDLPGRRRLSDAALWLWYEGHPIPAHEVRDRVLNHLATVDDHLAQLREETEADDVSERRLAAAEFATRQQKRADSFIDQLAAFPTWIEPGASSHQLSDTPHQQLVAAYVQVFLAMQGDDDTQPELARRLIESLFLAADPTDEPNTTDEILATIISQLDLSILANAVWQARDDEWKATQLFLRESFGYLAALSQKGSSHIARKMGRVGTRAVTTDGLLLAAAFTVAFIPQITELALRRSAD